jgi:large subunit ribosomal protein L6
MLQDSTLTVTRPSDNKTHRSLHGLTRSLLANMVHGVTNGFEKVLEISGVGYRAQKTDQGLSLQIGFNRPIEFNLPNGVEADMEGNNKIKLTGINKEQVGEVAAKIRALRPADPYKGKGIKYSGEVLRLKPGKAGKAAQKG